MSPFIRAAPRTLWRPFPPSWATSTPCTAFPGDRLPPKTGHITAHELCSVNLRVHCRYYADKTKISAFLAKATNQIIANCKAHIISAGKLWDQEMPKLLSRLELACGVHTAYVQALRCSPTASPRRTKKLQQILSKVRCRSAFAPELKAEAKVDETVVFIRMELFSKRCRKLVVLFTAVQQFSNLANVSLRGSTYVPHPATLP